MKVDNITIEVNPELVVGKRTAEGCLKLVEIYVNNTGCDILCSIGEDGSRKFEFAETPNLIREAANA